jgi:hypothetical protein
MKKKFALVNLILMLVVLFTSSYQSFHIVQHNHHQENAPKFFSGFHQYEQNNDFHLHLASEADADCEVCTFTFDFFVAPPTFFFPVLPSQATIPYQYPFQVDPQSFVGSLFSHRGPPALFV